MNGKSLFSLTSVLWIAGAILARAAAPLADAAEKGDWPDVEALLKEQTDAKSAQPDGTTPLHWAAHHDHLASVQALLVAGADAKAANHYGIAPISLACVNGSEAVITALLDAGADANTTTRGGESALMTAARTGRTGPVNVLLARGANVDATDRKGQTALMWAAADGHAAVVSQLLAAGAARDTRVASGFTAFLFAARQGRTEVIRTLLAAGVDANEAIETDKGGGRRPEAGTSALLLAVKNGHFELALELVKAGANPNDQRSGFTPLHTLTWVRRPSRGDDLDGQPPPDGSGSVTALEFAGGLVAAGAKVNAQLDERAGARGKLSFNGATPLLMAAKNADLDYMKLLVELGADANLPNKDGATPLLAAAGLGCFAPDEEAGTEAECLEAVAWLLKQGGDINHVDRNGETTMHAAAYKSLPKMVQFLAAHDAKPAVWNRKNKSGWTPVLIAEGFRPGNFKPSHETLAALHDVLRAADLPIPPPTPRPAVEPVGYDDGTGPKPGKENSRKAR
ncbi:MAG: ankyrin repeat domain-containing protein [Verrucomicrobiales bacterium]